MFDTIWCVYEFNQTCSMLFSLKMAQILSLKYLLKFLHSNDNSHDHDKQRDILSAVLVCDFCVIVLDMPCQYQQFIGFKSCCI